MIEFVVIVSILYFFWDPIEEWIERIVALVKRCAGYDCGCDCNKNKKIKTKKGKRQT